MLAHHLATMAHQNAWANHRLLAACAQLSQEDFVATRTSFFPSIKATLNHIVTVDWYYVDALERGVRGEPVNAGALAAFFEPEEPFETCAALGEAQHAVDRRLVALCERLGDDQLGVAIAVQRRDFVDHPNIVRLLSHLFEHQIHHRGQVHAMLAGSPVKPPQLDEFFLEVEAPLRARELAELGTSEAAIWRTASR